MMKNWKKWFVLIVCVFVLSPLFAQENDWADLGRYAALNKTVEIPSRVVFMGNSITEGWWHNDSLFFKENDFICRGISGQTTSQMLVRFRQDVINLRPKAVVILGGANDIAHNNGYISLENILGNIISMIELAELHHIDVVLCSILPAYEFSWNKGLEPANKIIELNKMLKAYANCNGITYVEYHSKMADERGGLPETYSGDGVHPNSEGYKVMKELLLPALKDY